MISSPVQHAAALSIRGVRKWFGTQPNRVEALRGVDLEVRTGEVIMLVGPSGCGKTTLISVASGILDRDAGECLVFGQDVQQLGSRARTLFHGRMIGFVFQQFNLLPSMSAVENVATQRLLQGEKLSAAISAAAEALDSVGLGDRLHHRPSQLSGGQQQRVAIARALVHRPQLLVCDEPTSALDHDTGQAVMRSLRQAAKERSTTVVVVTHDSRIFEFADRIAYMDDGRIVRIEQGADR